MLSYRKAGATLGALALGGTLLAAAVPAQAATPTPSTAPTGDGAKGICKRLPKTEQRVQKALDRLNGPATENGSVARLQQRVDNAKNAGQTAIYTYLNDRLTFRKSLLPTLTTRQSDLQSVATWCSSQGLAAPSGTAQ
ncbi:hypothetical protein OG500_09250 [Kitasatospora sp. NBC_01250]|uniref:hypothetical protein n=1 Tax=unclassified Kitasatospora TaxID=2633591 RepID=UPI002E14963D|nr:MULTISPECIES: hypothetical protein [unclassified Kitasatospora]WSJ66351.1 hypothetical protein OG294_09585 [Kitasatospora sp. NBC_01302]